MSDAEAAEVTQRAKKAAKSIRGLTQSLGEALERVSEHIFKISASEERYYRQTDFSIG